jgi:DNA-binding MarR family transcriptional regulator
LFLFNEEEFEVILKELIAGSVLYDLKKKGYVESYEDETTDEMIFLTKKGKKYLKEEKKLD